MLVALASTSSNDDDDDDELLNDRDPILAFVAVPAPLMSFAYSNDNPSILFQTEIAVFDLHVGKSRLP